ncbi:MAG: TetR/AcrR family transcriptional regulator [Firmicutes bacterium]|nr:TetR/AcrR family transcriptional regulator [Bacillota bacterium]
MKNTSAKDRILDSALTLFAQKGYDGASIDLIAQNSGLKGPSLYKHFKSKEEILDALIDKVEDYYQKNFGSEAHPGAIPSSAQELIDISVKRILFTLHDDTVRKTRRLLAMEQFRSPRIARLATRHSTDGLCKLYGNIFKHMMNAGALKKDDPDMLALSFIAPVTLLIQMCDREPGREQEAMELIRAHLDHFVNTYAIQR